VTQVEQVSAIDQEYNFAGAGKGDGRKQRLSRKQRRQRAHHDFFRAKDFVDEDG
jgi:hypothetical protein